MKKILIADDDKAMRALLRVVLQKKGYEVTLASDGKEALRLLQKDIPDLVVLDVMMPKLNGWEVAKKIREDKKMSGLPIIMLTAKDEMIDKLMGFESGVNEYIVKPLKPASITAAVKKLLGE